uniref:Uncharacterized protein n=1 Tax=Glossina pallidipes TaxID=7398 RepID=A0A1B0GGN1_GLOPL
MSREARVLLFNVNQTSCNRFKVYFAGQQQRTCTYSISGSPKNKNNNSKSYEKQQQHKHQKQQHPEQKQHTAITTTKDRPQIWCCGSTQRHQRQQQLRRHCRWLLKTIKCNK